MIKQMSKIFGVGFIWLLLIVPVYAVTDIVLPIDCSLGEDCWIVNLPSHYVDDKRSQKQVDFLCGPKTYTGHKGTDFAIRDREKMYQGVNVIAVTDALVRGVRDGMEDISVKQTGEDAVKGKECGNGVVLRADDFEYQYCHLKNGSIKLHKGQTVKKGQVLGQVGLSGNTEYPHLHLSVRKKRGETWLEFDPFYGMERKCGLQPSAIWEKSLNLAEHVKTGIVYHYGFSYDEPTVLKVRDGVYDNLTYRQNPKIITAWVEIFSANIGDRVVVSLDTGDDVLIKEYTFDKYKARYFFFVGKKLRGRDLNPVTKMNIEYHHADGKVDNFEKHL